MDFCDMTPIFGEVEAVWSAPSTTPLEPFLFRVHGLQNDPSGLRIIVTDFQSNTFEAIRTRHQLEDMKDNIGIGGNWSEFVDYIRASVKSEDVKLILEGQSESGGASHAKLIAQKGKGMPRMSVSLAKLSDVVASQAMASLSMELYKEYKNVHKSLVKEQERSFNLTVVVAAEREKNESLQNMLSRKNKSQKMDTENSDSKSASSPQDASDKQITQNQNSTKAPNRVVPAHRRAKVRGAVLVDIEDDD
ncbi:Hypothetical predicted protein [Olea europaea subsp. europaea]|uniref:Uncharacterized protein n=1 Tax=Olea europaea subsp. europaea TaxID=158383 RepID=A0A8S0V456_OLEEU|nr:Hypothetical predicted protein [Olea europaea subsp. europaea]